MFAFDRSSSTSRVDGPIGSIELVATRTSLAFTARSFGWSIAFHRPRAVASDQRVVRLTDITTSTRVVALMVLAIGLMRKGAR